MACLEAAGAAGAVIGEPGEQAEEVAGGVGASALDADATIDGQDDGLLGEVDGSPFGTGRAVDEAAVHL